MPATDLHHQRLRHLFASAILELWKKETGSVTSVLIEGTVCVTVHGGRTTVVQLCERFTGLVNGDCERPEFLPEVSTGPRPGDSHLGVTVATPQAAGKPCSRSLPAIKDSNNNVRTSSGDGDDEGAAGTGSVETDLDDNECSLVGDDDIEDGQSSMLVDDDEASDANTQTSYSQVTVAKLDIDSTADDSAIHDMSISRSNMSLANDSYHSPERGPPNIGCNDLLLSSPHDYTAQVRNVIRQRLLNANGNKHSLSAYRGQGMCTSAGSNSTRPLTSPYYRPAADATPPSPLWIKPETPGAAASEAMATAARRFASQYAAAAAASGQIPMTLMSPPPLAMSVGLPLPGVPLGANLHNLLGLKSTTAPGAGPAMVSGAGSAPARAPTSTPDSKRGNGEPALSGNSTDSGQSSEQKIYRCDYCNKTFLFKSKYHEHLPVHTSARPFQCHLCTRTYKYKYDLRVHLRTHLGIPTKSTVCPFCAARFPTNKFLRQHMREAHSNQDAASSGPAAVVAPVDETSEAPTAIENVSVEHMKEAEIRTELTDEVDESADAELFAQASETVSDAQQNDDGEQQISDKQWLN